MLQNVRLSFSEYSNSLLRRGSKALYSLFNTTGVILTAGLVVAGLSIAAHRPIAGAAFLGLSALTAWYAGDNRSQTRFEVI